jgi:hypothetical protein
VEAGDHAGHLLLELAGQGDGGEPARLPIGALGEVAELGGDSGVGLVAGAGDVLGDVGAQPAELRLAVGKAALEADLAGGG